MEQNVSNVEDPGATKAAAKQATSAKEEGEKITSDEEVVKETVERLLQDELEKLLVEEEPEKEGEPSKPEEEGEKPIVEDAGKFTEKEKPRKDWDNITLLDELSPFSEDEEEMDNSSLQDETMEKEEKKQVEQNELISRPPQSLWAQCRERIRGSISGAGSGGGSKRKISMLPFGYFSGLRKVFSKDVPLEEEKEVRDEEAQPQPQKLKHPMLSRLFTFIVSEEQTKKAVLRRPTVFLGENVASIPPITSHDVLEGQDRGGSAVTVESELEDEHSSSPEILLSRPENSSSESTKKEAQKTEASAKRRGAATGQPKKPESDSFYSYPGIGSSVWSMGQHITHWKLAHHRGYHADQLTQDKIYKCRLLKHERDTKAAVPLPLQEVIEEEVLAILRATLLDYQEKLGLNNPLTIQMEAAVDHLHLQLCARSVI